MEIKSPFKFLDSYTREDRDIFFGREQEINELYRRVFESKILLVYGISGTGKSSLIHCGLANKIQESDWLPINVRRGGDIVSSMGSAIQHACLSPLKETPSTASQFMKAVRSLYLDYYKPIFFIFDQFEELFIFGSKEEQKSLVKVIKSLADSELQCRFIFVMREEYLAGITELEKTIPNFLTNRVRIEHMSFSNAKDAVEGPCKIANIELEEGFADSLLERLSPESTEVELTYLQVFLDKIYRLSMEERPDNEESRKNLAFNKELLNRTGNVSDLLGSFLDEQIAQLNDPDSALAVLKSFVSVKGTKRQMSSEEVQDYTIALGKPIEAEPLRQLIQTFIHLRILRDKDQNGRYELRHDALAEKIYEKITLVEKELLEIRQLIENAYNNWQKRGVLLNREDLEYIAPYESRLYLPLEYNSLVDKSKKEFIKARQRRRNLISAGTILLICVLGGFTFWAMKEKQIATRIEIQSSANYFSALAKTEVEVDPTNALQLAMYGYSLSHSKEILNTCRSIYFQNPIYKNIKLEKAVNSIFFREGKIVLYDNYRNKVFCRNILNNSDSVFFSFKGGATISSYNFSEAWYELSSDRKRLLINTSHESYVLDRYGRLIDSFKVSEKPEILSNLDFYTTCDISGDGKHLLRFDILSPTINIYSTELNSKVLKLEFKNPSSAIFIPGRKDEILVSQGNDLVIVESHGKIIRKKTLPSRGYKLFPDLKQNIFVVSGERTLSILDYDLNLVNTISCKSLIKRLAFSEDGEKMVGSSTDKSIYSWDISGNLLAEFKANMEDILWVDFYNKDTLISCSKRNVKLWPLYGLIEDINKVKVPPGFMMSDHNKFIYKVLDENIEIKDLRTGKTYNKKIPECGEYPVLAEKTGTIFINSYSCHQLFTWNFINGIFKIEALPRAYLSYALSDKSSYFIGVSYQDPVTTVFLKDSTGATLHTFNPDQDDLYPLYLEHDSIFLFTVADKSCSHLWKYNGKRIATLRGHKGIVNNIAISHNKKMILTAAADNTVRIWDFTGNQLCILNGHKSSVTSAAFSSNDEYILTTSTDNTARLWDLDGNILRIYQGFFTGGIRYGEFLNNDREIVLVASDNTICHWSLKPDFSNYDSPELSMNFKIKYGIINFDQIISTINNIKLLHEAAETYNDLAFASPKSEVTRQYSGMSAQLLMKSFNISANNSDFMYLMALVPRRLENSVSRRITSQLISSLNSIDRTYKDEISELLINVITLINSESYKGAENEINYLRLIDEALHQNHKKTDAIIQNVSDFSYALMKSGKIQQAELILEKISKLSPENQYVISNLALVYTLSNQMDKALPIYKKHMNEEFKGVGPFKQAFLDDIKDFEKDGISCAGFIVIKEMLGK